MNGIKETLRGIIREEISKALKEEKSYNFSEITKLFLSPGKSNAMKTVKQLPSYDGTAVGETDDGEDMVSIAFLKKADMVKAIKMLRAQQPGPTYTAFKEMGDTAYYYTIEITA